MESQAGGKALEAVDQAKHPSLLTLHDPQLELAEKKEEMGAEVEGCDGRGPRCPFQRE